MSLAAAGAAVGRELGETTVSYQQVSERVLEMKKVIAELKSQCEHNREVSNSLNRKLESGNQKKFRLLETLHDLNQRLDHSAEDVRLVTEERANAIAHRDEALRRLDEARRRLSEVETENVEATRIIQVAQHDEKTAKMQLASVDEKRSLATRQALSARNNLKRVGVATTKRTVASDYYTALLRKR